MRFVETPIFTRQIKEMLSEGEYRALQGALILRPAQGALIRGSGGLRKIRFGLRGRGKRGGARVIYYWHDGEKSLRNTAGPLLCLVCGGNLQERSGREFVAPFRPAPDWCPEHGHWFEQARELKRRGEY